MSHPLIRDEEHYLIMEPGEKEKFLSAQETLEWLEKWLKKMEVMPEDLKDQNSYKSAAKRLLDTSCDLQIKQGFSIEWFAIRLEKPSY